MHTSEQARDCAELPEFDYGCLHFRALAPIVDLIYGAVIGYPILLFGELLGSFFDTSAAVDVRWVNVTLVGFVFLYSLSDAVETRMMTDQFPYQGRGRFSVDLGIALAFFLTFAGAAKGSPNFLVPFSAIFFLGAAWGVYLHQETRASCKWRYPKGVVLSHIAAGCVWLATWLSLRERGVTQLGWNDTCWLMGYYVGWLGLSTAAKEIYGVPPVEADLFPTSLIDVGVRKIIKFFRET